MRRHDEGLVASEGPRLTLLRGTARLERGHARPTARVTDGRSSRLLQAPRMVLATGSSPVLVPVVGLDPSEALTNETVFELDAPPRAMAVIGGGATGCELALAFARLGCRVTLLEERARVLADAEPDASALVHAGLERAGVRVLTRAIPRALAGRRLEVDGPDGPIAVTAVERVLMACGRRAEVSALGLEAAGVACAAGAVVTDRDHRTTVPGVYAIGDVTGRVGSTHAANAQGRRLVRRFLLPLPLLPEGPYPSVVFTDPEVAQVGPSLASLRARFGDLVAVQRVDLAATDRGRIMGIDQGFVQLCAMRASGRLLAATVVGPHAGDLLTPLTLVVRRRQTLWGLSRLVVAYPTLSEAVRLAADAFVFAHLPRLHLEVLDYLRGRWRRPAPRS